LNGSLLLLLPLLLLPPLMLLLLSLLCCSQGAGPHCCMYTGSGLQESAEGSMMYCMTYWSNGPGGTAGN
jgi:hypothetical protein